MQLGNSIVQSFRRDTMEIARRFNAANAAKNPQVPERRPSVPAAYSSFHSAVPTGLAVLFAANPALKRWAIISCPSGTRGGGQTRLNSRNTFAFGSFPRRL